MALRTDLFALLFFCGALAAAAQPAGLVRPSDGHDAKGFVLFCPVNSDTAYLIGKSGQVIHKWACGSKPGLTSLLLPDGSLLRAGEYVNSAFGKYGARGGLIERYAWDGRLLWSFVLSDSAQTQNHDLCILPNGNIIAVVWEKIPIAEAIACGRDRSTLDSELWSAKLIELQPAGTDKANIVWQWRAWDHIIQDRDAAKPNYGVVSQHPELLNLNYTNTFGRMLTDWIHLNAVSYNARLDQVVICSRHLSEIYIIDHSTTTAEAATHKGGLRGKGGDLLYRWGNPAAYNRGTANDEQLFQPHDPTWLAAGSHFPGGIMIFNNGVSRPNGRYSSVDIIIPPVDAKGNYIMDTSAPAKPVSVAWSYKADPPQAFFSNTMGSAQMLPNGNILLCEANKGTFIEIDLSGNTVWKYVNPACGVAPYSEGAVVRQNGCAKGVFYDIGYPGVKDNEENSAGQAPVLSQTGSPDPN